MGQQTLRVLVGHLRPSARARAMQQIDAHAFAATEVAFPMALRQQALTTSPEMVVCPRGWLGEEDRRDFGRQGIHVIELDVETVSSAEFTSALEKGKVAVATQTKPAPAAQDSRPTPAPTPAPSSGKPVAPALTRGGSASAHDRATEELRSSLAAMKRESRSRGAPVNKKRPKASSKGGRIAAPPGLAKIALVVGVVCAAALVFWLQMRGL